METRRRIVFTKGKRGLLAIAVLAVLLLLLMAVPAFAADRWSDISDSEWLATYKITADQASTVADGYPDGTFRPNQAVIRAQSAKMIVDGFGVPTATPATPTFSDVPSSHYYYPWIEGGYAAQIINGFSDGTFRPEDSITRQQFNSMLGLNLAQEEIEGRGGILGSTGQYATLAAWFAAEGETILSGFQDAGSVAAVHRPATAYLILRGVILGRSVGQLKYLDPMASLTRAQAVAMIVRARTAAEDFIDTTAPTVTINQAGGQADPTSASPINFTVVFSEAVTGFTAADVTLAGTAGGTLVGTVSGTGPTYTVAVSGMTTSGTVIASIAAGRAQDAAGNPNTASTSSDNTVTYIAADVTGPTVTINQKTTAPAQADPTSASPINFTVVFSEAVTDFAAGDVTLGGTAGATTATVTGSGTTYNVAVSGMTQSGTVIASIPAGRAHDADGNPNTASTSTDNTVTYDVTAPTVTINQAGGQADPTSASPINFTVVFSEAVTGFATGDVTFTGSTAGGPSSAR